MGENFKPTSNFCYLVNCNIKGMYKVNLQSDFAPRCFKDQVAFICQLSTWKY